MNDFFKTCGTLLGLTALLILVGFVSSGLFDKHEKLPMPTQEPSVALEKVPEFSSEAPFSVTFLGYDIPLSKSKAIAENNPVFIRLYSCISLDFATEEELSSATVSSDTRTGINGRLKIVGQGEGGSANNMKKHYLIVHPLSSTDKRHYLYRLVTAEEEEEYFFSVWVNYAE